MIKFRSRACLTIGFAVLFSASPWGTANGQTRRLPNVQTLQPGRRVNPAHERLKTEADQQYRKGNFQRTVELTSRVLRENPRDHVALYLRGSARAELARRNNDAKGMRAAISDARRAISYDRAQTHMYYLPYLYGMVNLAVIENNMEHAKVAVKVAGQVLSARNVKNDDKANLYYQRGTANVVLEDFDKAATDFQSAIRISRTHLGAHMAAADAYARAGKLDQAKAQYDTAIRTFPDNPLVYNNRGMLLQRQKKYSEAILDFTRALELNGNYYVAYTNRGFCLLNDGRPESAEADFTKSLQINSRQPSVYSLRATARKAQNNLTGALADNRAALKLTPRNPQAHADLAFTLFFAGKYAEAVKSFDASLKLNDKQRHLAPWKFAAMQLAGQKDEAMKLFAEDLAKPDKDRDWVDALLVFVAGKIDEKALLASVNRDKKAVQAAQTCEAHYFIGLRYRAAGDEDTAQTHFNEAVATKQLQLSAYHGAQLARRKGAKTKTGS